MAQHFRQHVPSNRYQLAGRLTLGGADELDQVDINPLGAVEDLSVLLINIPIHEVIAVQSSGERDWLRQVIEDCDYFRVRLRIVHLKDPDNGPAIRNDLRQGIHTLPIWMQAIVRGLIGDHTAAPSEPQPRPRRATATA